MGWLAALPGRLGAVAAAGLLVAIVGALTANVVARTFGLPLVGAGTAAQWAFAVLAFAALPSLLAEGEGFRGLATRLFGAFVAVSLAVGLWEAAARVGGVEPVLGWPSAWRFLLAAAFAALGLAGALHGGPGGALAAAAGACLAIAPLPALPFAAGLGVFAAALALRVPVAIGLLAAVLVSPGVLSDAALAQTVMRGLSTYVLLAVPLFVLAAALMVAGGIGERIVAAALWLARARRTAFGEANVIASLIFGGVSGSSIADAAMGARLLVPAMVAAGYPPGRAAAVTAASAVLPNVLPPSIALLLAAAATDQSVGALWLSGVGAGFALAAALWVAVRLTPPADTRPRRPDEGRSGDPRPGPADGSAPTAQATRDRPHHAQARRECGRPPSAGTAPPAGALGAAADEGGERAATPSGRAVLAGLLPPVLIAVGVLGGLRLGIVTAVEAGLLAVAIAAAFAIGARGPVAVVEALGEAAVQAGRVAILIAAAAPVAFLFATSGFDVGALLPAGSALGVLLAGIALCLVVGTALDVGAAILLVLPVLVPAAAAAGADPVHAALVFSIALLLGGLTPPVGMLVLVVKDVSGAGGVYRAVVPYLLALVAALGIIAAVPAVSVGLVRLF